MHLGSLPRKQHGRRIQLTQDRGPFDRDAGAQPGAIARSRQARTGPRSTPGGASPAWLRPRRSTPGTPSRCWPSAPAIPRTPSTPSRPRNGFIAATRG